MLNQIFYFTYFLYVSEWKKFQTIYKKLINEKKQMAGYLEKRTEMKI